LKQYFESIESGNYGQILHGIWLHCGSVVFPFMYMYAC